MQNPLKSKLEVLYEDDNFLCINKPSGMVVNRSETHKGYTLQDWTEDNVILEDTPSEKEFTNRVGLVHRLDKETSGVLLIAKNANTFKKLQEQFKERTVEKSYLALVFGTFKDIKIGEVFRVDAPISRNPSNRQSFAIVRGGRSSITEFKILQGYSLKDTPGYTLIECRPKSGRTHQIRVHLTALNHPVIGDKLYSGKKRSKKYEKVFKRQFLHSQKITFNNPSTNKSLTIVAPAPKDFEIVLNFLQKESKRAG